MTASLEKVALVKADEITGKRSGVDCGHLVCRLSGRQESCMVRSGEVVREYDMVDGQVSWAVLKKDGRHVVVACDVKYVESVESERWDGTFQLCLLRELEIEIV